jgi:hypothetical protein
VLRAIAESGVANVPSGTIRRMLDRGLIDRPRVNDHAAGWVAWRLTIAGRKLLGRLQGDRDRPPRGERGPF